MPYLKLEAFSGISPRTGPTNLQPNQAQVAKNVKLQSGELRPWRKSVLAYQPGLSDTHTIYKLENLSTGGSAWLEWATDVDVVPSPVADISDYRVYYTDGVAPKKTNWAMATTSGTGVKPFPNASYNLGVPGPAAAPTLALVQPLTGVSILTGGDGYTSVPTVAFGSGAAAGTAVISGEIKSITVTTAGVGYLTAPTVVITGGGGAGATATAVLGTGTTAGTVASVTIVSKGTGYTSAPSISFIGGGFTTVAVADAAISAKVVSVKMTAFGSYATAPSVTFSGGGAVTQATGEGSFAPIETRAYVFTYISTFGSVLEESAPSPAALVTCSTTGATVTVSAFGTAPITSAGYNITAIRIYRSVTGATSSTYFYVGTLPVTPATGLVTGTFADTVTVANLGAALSSLYFTPPPAGLRGLVTMPNGILAGFIDNQVWFSEPYLPHAWPANYMMTVGSPIVGLGVYGQTLVVCTTQNPFLITGSQPGAMSQEKVSLPEPCMSKLSIASDQSGVLYASPNGLVAVGPGTQDVISRALFTRDEWQTYNPTGMVGVIYQNMYLGFYQAGEAKSALVLMRGDSPPLVTLDVPAQAIFVQKTTASVYYVSPLDNNIYQLDADPVNYTSYEWMSKVFILPEPTNFAALKLQANWDGVGPTAAYNAYVAALAAANQAIWAAGTPLNSTLNAAVINGMQVNGSILANIPSAIEVQSVQAYVYANNVLVASYDIDGPEPLRLPADRKEYMWEVMLTGTVPLRSFRMATSIGELRLV